MKHRRAIGGSCFSADQPTGLCGQQKSALRDTFPPILFFSPRLSGCRRDVGAQVFQGFAIPAGGQFYVEPLIHQDIISAFSQAAAPICLAVSASFVATVAPSCSPLVLTVQGGVVQIVDLDANEVSTFETVAQDVAFEADPEEPQLTDLPMPAP